jgi:DNA-binding beta-propeller fold protein YncE
MSTMLPEGEKSGIARVSACWFAASVLTLVLLGPVVAEAPAGMAGRGMRGPGRGMSRRSGPPDATERVWEPRRSYRSPFDLAFAPEGGTLAVSDRTGRRLYIVDTEAGRVAREIELRGQPMGVAWQGEGRVVVSEYDAGTVAEVDAKTGDVLRRFLVGLKPVGVAVAPKRGLVVVCDYGLHAAAIVDLKTGRERARSSCGRHPYFVAVTPDEALAVVGNLVPTGPATDPASSAVISLIDLNAGTRVKNISLPGGSSNIRQVRVSADGRWAYAVHTQGRTVLPTTQVERAWINTNALSIIDLASKELYATVLLDTINEGAADPWGIAVAPDGKTAWVSIAGVQQIAKIELARLHEFLAGQGDIGSLGMHDAYSGPAAIWQSIKEDPGKRGELAYRLSAPYTAGLLSRVSIPAQCPQGIALSPEGNQLAVASYYSGEVLLLDPGNCRVTKTVSLGPQPGPDAVRHGEFVFHDARHCFQHWLSCSTCHPDGRADGMNWDLANDGIGNPKNARSLVLSSRTPPSMSLGIRENMEEAVEKGFRFVQFREIEPDDLDAVRAYVASLEPEESPWLVVGRLSEKALKGQDIFEDAKVGCARCHPAPLFTALRTHEVGTQHEFDCTGRFDTPTCVELWCTGPYLHDGSAVTLREVLTTMNRDDKHGRTSHLSPEEIDALVEYLLSL